MFKKKPKNEEPIRMNVEGRHIDYRINNRDSFVEVDMGENSLEGLVSREPGQRGSASNSSTMIHRHKDIPDDFVDPGMEKVRKMMAKQKSLKSASRATKNQSSALENTERDQARIRAQREQGPIGEEGFVKK